MSEDPLSPALSTRMGSTTQERIRTKRANLRADLVTARQEVEKVQLAMRHLVALCTHPDAYDTSHMGENCRDCPDCGGCDVR